MGPKTQPNFIVGGATASGTSFLTHILLQHSNIYMPNGLDQEPHFFSVKKRYEMGMEEYYKRWFSAYQGQFAVGERSTSYFHFKETAHRLHMHLPEVKLLFVLRDPIERAFAQYRYMVLRGKEELDFASALAVESEREDREKRHHEYAGRSLYGEQLEQFLRFYPRENILLLSSEKLRDETKTQVKRVTDFLGIGEISHFTVSSEFSSGSVKDRKVQREIANHFGKKFKYIVESLRYDTGDVQRYIESSGDLRFFNALVDNLAKSKEPLSQEIRGKLCDFFARDQDKFFALTQGMIDFGPWF